MGTWGPKLYEDDLAEDIKNEYEELLEKGKNNKEAIEDIYQIYKEEIEDSEEKSVFWMVLADILYKNKNLTELSNIPIESAIKEGDKILTSGLGEMYPKEIRIGEVISVEVDNVGIMKRAVVKPYVDFNKLEELFVVVPKEKVDTDASGVGEAAEEAAKSETGETIETEQGVKTTLTDEGVDGSQTAQAAEEEANSRDRRKRTAGKNKHDKCWCR